MLLVLGGLRVHDALARNSADNAAQEVVLSAHVEARVLDETVRGFRRGCAQKSAQPPLHILIFSSCCSLNLVLFEYPRFLMLCLSSVGGETVDTLSEHSL